MGQVPARVALRPRDTDQRTGPEVEVPERYPKDPQQPITGAPKYAHLALPKEDEKIRFRDPERFTRVYANDEASVWRIGLTMWGSEVQVLLSAQRKCPITWRFSGERAFVMTKRSRPGTRQGTRLCQRWCRPVGSPYRDSVKTCRMGPS